MATKKKKVTEAEKAAAIKAARAGSSHTELAKKYNVSIATIGNWLRADQDKQMMGTCPTCSKVLRLLVKSMSKAEKKRFVIDLMS